MHESHLKRDIPRKITKQVVLRTIKKSVAEFSHSLRRFGTLALFARQRPLSKKADSRCGNGSRFHIDVIAAEGARIPVDSLIRASDGEPLPSPLVWEFSGSDFNDLYPPDLSGDFAIFWHAHDSVLRIKHDGIASGTVKLEPVPHPGLKDGDPVTLELVPVGS